ARGCALRLLRARRRRGAARRRERSRAAHPRRVPRAALHHRPRSGAAHRRCGVRRGGRLEPRPAAAPRHDRGGVALQSLRAERQRREGPDADHSQVPPRQARAPRRRVRGARSRGQHPRGGADPAGIRGAGRKPGGGPAGLQRRRRRRLRAVRAEDPRRALAPGAGRLSRAAARRDRLEQRQRELTMLRNALLLLAVSIPLAIPLAPAAAAPETRVTAADVAEIHAVINRQIDAFRHDDAQGAFALASPAVQRTFRTPQKFLDVVRMAYRAVYRPAAVAFLDLLILGDEVVQQVQVTDRGGMVWLAY